MGSPQPNNEFLTAELSTHFTLLTIQSHSSATLLQQHHSLSSFSTTADAASGRRLRTTGSRSSTTHARSPATLIRGDSAASHWSAYTSRRSTACRRSDLWLSRTCAAAFLKLPTRACEANLVSVLPRLAARTLATGVDPYHWKLLCRQGLVSAVKHDNLKMVELLHELCPTVLPYLPMVEAARTGSLRLLEWLSDRHDELVTFIPHMMDAAASTGQLTVLQWLHEHPKNGECTTDAFEFAVVEGHLETVKWLLEYYGDGAKIRWRESRTSSPSQFAETIKFLFEHHPRKFGHELPNTLGWFIRRGNLEMVQWLYAKSKEPSLSYNIGKFDDKPIDQAASFGHLHVVQWLHDHVPDSCTKAAMDEAAANGHLEVVQWLHENRTEGCTTSAMDRAVANRHLDVVKWLHANRTEGCASYAMYSAATRGDLEMIEWLRENGAARRPCNAMNWTARNGHLDVIKWLHQDRAEQCTSAPMNYAAQAGHFEVVRWLHENRTEGCTSDAMDEAAECGHLETVKWLHENRTEGCTTQAMDCAAKNKHLSTVKWLHENRTEGCTSEAMDLAACYGHLDVVKWLHENRDEGCTVEAMQRTLDNGHLDILVFLDVNRSEGYGAYKIDNSAACIKHMEVVQWAYAKHPDSVDGQRLISCSGSSYMTGLLKHILEQGSAVA